MSSPLKVSDLSVLVVEDDEVNLHVAVELLQRAGVSIIHTAANGTQGLKQLKALKQVDVLMLDIYMPGMDGIEFLSNLAKQGFAGKLILVSGVNLETLFIAREIATENGLHIISIMEKPLQQTRLDDALKSAIQ